ncbi:MAG TPA: FtsX-like permease family protein, partial [Chthoniobacterales bacterium]
MTPPLYIALRFLTHRKRAFILSLGGVVFGVAIFICGQAQTAGFEKNFIDANLGTNGGLVLSTRIQPKANDLFVAGKTSNVNAAHRRYFEGITDPSGIMRVSRQFANVAACTPVLRGLLSARAGFETASVTLFGIDPATYVETTNLRSQISGGHFDDFRNNPRSVIVGARLAGALAVQAGDTLELLSPGGEYQRFTVAAVARSGIGSEDARRIYIHRRIAQRLLLKPYSASMIVYKLRDPEEAPSLARHFEMLFQHVAESWQEREEGNLQLFATLQISAAITVSLIILLAGFGIFNVLTMTVLSKLKEIAILRSMGYRRGDISAIFLWQGALIGVIGSILGCLVGGLMTWGVSRVPIKVRGLLYANHFLVSWNWHHYFWATVLAIIAVFIASYVPARRAGFLS